jgi:hypothetical protein
MLSIVDVNLSRRGSQYSSTPGEHTPPGCVVGRPHIKAPATYGTTRRGGQPQYTQALVSSWEARFRRESAPDCLATWGPFSPPLPSFPLPPPSPACAAMLGGGGAATTMTMGQDKAARYGASLDAAKTTTTRWRATAGQGRRWPRPRCRRRRDRGHRRRRSREGPTCCRNRRKRKNKIDPPCTERLPSLKPRPPRENTDDPAAGRRRCLRFGRPARPCPRRRSRSAVPHRSVHSAEGADDNDDASGEMTIRGGTAFAAAATSRLGRRQFPPPFLLCRHLTATAHGGGLSLRQAHATIKHPTERI